MGLGVITLMQKCVRVFLCLFLVISLAGCFSNPLSRFKAAEAKVAATQDKKEAVEEKIQSKAVPYVYGAFYSLGQDPEPSKWSVVAKKMTDSALTITGPPSFKDSLEFKTIVDGLLATNSALIKAAEVKLAVKNQEVIQLQGQIVGLEEKLTVVTRARDLVSENNAGLASKWAKLVKWFWIIIWIIGIGLGLHFLSFIVPSPYNSIFFCISALMGGFARILFRIFPLAKSYGKVVAEDVHLVTKTALTDVIKGVEKARQDPVVAEKLNTELKAAMDNDSKIEVTNIKRGLGNV